MALLERIAPSRVSGFRLSFGQRLLAAACLLAPLWATVIWTIR